MPLAALLIAGDVAGPRVLGVEMIEFQLRRAHAAGVGHAIIFCERVTSPLIDSVDAVRREGLSVDIARSVADAAELVHPDEAVLLLATDVIVAADRLAELAGSSEPMLLCVRDDPANDVFELIDPTARWTGFARLDGGLLRRTAAMIGDWDLQSTLLRRAVQEGAGRIMLAPDEAGADLILLGSGATAQLAGNRLVAAACLLPEGWGSHWLVAPIARLLARVNVDVGIPSQWLTLAGFCLCGLATGAALAGWIVASLVLLLLGIVFDAVSSIVTQAGCRHQALGGLSLSPCAPGRQLL